MYDGYWNTWGKVFISGLSKFFGKQSLKILKGHGMLSRLSPILNTLSHIMVILFTFYSAIAVFFLWKIGVYYFNGIKFRGDYISRITPTAKFWHFCWNLNSRMNYFEIICKFYGLEVLKRGQQSYIYVYPIFKRLK